MIGENDIGFRDLVGVWIGSYPDNVMGVNLGCVEEDISLEEADTH